MPKLTNMKIDRAMREKLMAPSLSTDYEGPTYPYGLTVNLEEDAVEKLNLGKLPRVGDTMTLIARVDVASVSSHESTDGKRRSVSLQITDMLLEAEDDAAAAAQALYTS